MHAGDTWSIAVEKHGESKRGDMQTQGMRVHCFRRLHSLPHKRRCAVLLGGVTGRCHRARV